MSERLEQQIENLSAHAVKGRDRDEEKRRKRREKQSKI